MDGIGNIHCFEARAFALDCELRQGRLTLLGITATHSPAGGWRRTVCAASTPAMADSIVCEEDAERWDGLS